MKENEPCRYCQYPLRKRLSEFKPKKLKKSYFYTAYFYCDECNRFYMSDKFKIETKDLKKYFI